MKHYKLTDENGKEYMSTSPGILGGHKKLKIYGQLDCPSALRHIENGEYVKQRVFFESEKTAIRAGYRPCGVCMKKEYNCWKLRRQIEKEIASFVEQIPDVSHGLEEKNNELFSKDFFACEKNEVTMFICDRECGYTVQEYILQSFLWNIFEEKFCTIEYLYSGYCNLFFFIRKEQLVEHYDESILRDVFIPFEERKIITTIKYGKKEYLVFPEKTLIKELMDDDLLVEIEKQIDKIAKHLIENSNIDEALPSEDKSNWIDKAESFGWLSKEST